MLATRMRFAAMESIFKKGLLFYALDHRPCNDNDDVIAMLLREQMVGSMESQDFSRHHHLRLENDE